MDAHRHPSRRTFVAGTAAAALSAPAFLRTASAADEPVSVALATADASAIAIYALKMGFFKNAGLDVQLTVLSSGPAIAAAVAGGAVNIGAMNVGSLATARSRDVPLRIVAPGSVVTSQVCGDVIMVGKNSTLHSGADFNNKTIATVALKTTQQACFLAWVDKYGGDSKTVKFYEIPFAEMPALLESGKVDATMPVEPFTAKGSQSGGRILASGYAVLPVPFLIYVFAASEPWIQAHPATAVKFNAAIRDAAVWANAHPKESLTLMLDFMKVDPSLASLMIPRTWGATVTPALLAPVIDVMYKYGILAKAVTPADLMQRPA